MSNAPSLPHPPYQWNLSQREDTGTYEGRKLLRLHELMRIEHGGEYTITSVWELPNGYTNLGTYAVTVAAPAGSTHHHLIVQYGMEYMILRRDRPLSELLALDGLDVLVEYQEVVKGVTIEPTCEQISAFLRCYTPLVETWVATCQCQEDMADPMHLTDLEIFQAVHALLNEEQTLHRRAFRKSRDLLLHPYQGVSQKDGGLFSALYQVHEVARRQLYVWWKSTYVDYTFPLSPNMDHEYARTLADIEYQGRSWKKISAYGQIAIVSYEPDGIPAGFDLVEAVTGGRIAIWRQSGPEGKAIMTALAASYSALTDWQQFKELTLRQRRGLAVRMREIRLEACCREPQDQLEQSV